MREWIFDVLKRITKISMINGQVEDEAAVGAKTKSFFSDYALDKQCKLGHSFGWRDSLNTPNLLRPTFNGAAAHEELSNP